jgi:hypothetical protein
MNVLYMFVRRMASTGIALAVLVLLATGEAAALRCGNELVSEGDIRPEVLAKCGEPADRTVYYEKRRVGSVTKIVPVEVWTYNFGRQTFIHFLTFENGQLTGIETGGYGF